MSAEYTCRSKFVALVGKGDVSKSGKISSGTHNKKQKKKIRTKIHDIEIRDLRYIDFYVVTLNFCELPDHLLFIVYFSICQSACLSICKLFTSSSSLEPVSWFQSNAAQRILEWGNSRLVYSNDEPSPFLEGIIHRVKWVSVTQRSCWNVGGRFQRTGESFFDASTIDGISFRNYCITQRTTCIYMYGFSTFEYSRTRHIVKILR